MGKAPYDVHTVCSPMQNDKNSDGRPLTPGQVRRGATDIECNMPNTSQSPTEKTEKCYLDRVNRCLCAQVTLRHGKVFLDESKNFNYFFNCL